jgi:SAM-dependent methyltransferase
MESAMRQGRLWGAAAQDWAERQEILALPLWEAMLDAAAVGPGTHVLDAGCGAGGASVRAARRGALVNGLDAAEALLAIARRRLPDGDFRTGDLEALPYPSGTFDAILVADVLPYVGEPVAVLRELRRVCAWQGRLVVATWGLPEECAQWAIDAAVRPVLPVPPDVERFALSGPGALEGLLAQAGLVLIGDGTVACLAEYPDGETLWQAQAAAGPLQAALRVVGAAPLKVAVLRAVAPYRTSTGGVRLQNHFRYVVATPHNNDDRPTR